MLIKCDIVLFIYVGKYLIFFVIEYVYDCNVNNNKGMGMKNCYFGLYENMYIYFEIFS